MLLVGIKQSVSHVLFITGHLDLSQSVITSVLESITHSTISSNHIVYLWKKPDVITFKSSRCHHALSETRSKKGYPQKIFTAYLGKESFIVKVNSVHIGL